MFLTDTFSTDKTSTNSQGNEPLTNPLELAQAATRYGGEHSAEVRQRICAAFEFLGARVDAAANHDNATVISTPDSAVMIGVEPTNEEWIAARHAQTLLAP